METKNKSSNSTYIHGPLLSPRAKCEGTDPGMRKGEVWGEQGRRRAGCFVLLLVPFCCGRFCFWCWHAKTGNILSLKEAVMHCQQRAVTAVWGAHGAELWAVGGPRGCHHPSGGPSLPLLGCQPPAGKPCLLSAGSCVVWGCCLLGVVGCFPGSGCRAEQLQKPPAFPPCSD